MSSAERSGPRPTRHELAMVMRAHELVDPRTQMGRGVPFRKARSRAFRMGLLHTDSRGRIRFSPRGLWARILQHGIVFNWRRATRKYRVQIARTIIQAHVQTFEAQTGQRMPYNERSISTVLGMLSRSYDHVRDVHMRTLRQLGSMRGTTTSSQSYEDTLRRRADRYGNVLDAIKGTETFLVLKQLRWD